MNKVALIHTTPVTIPLLKELIAKHIPDCQINNYLDDSILPSLKDSANEAKVESHWISLARIAEENGAECILSACSSVGAIVERARNHVGIPVLRIDEAMVEHAVATGSRVGVAATLDTTMGPTMTLLKRKAEEAGKDIEWHSVVVSDAYDRLMQGDQEGHDRVLAEQLSRLSESCDVVVLAQASMARVLPSLPADLQGKFLSSPESGVLYLKRKLQEL